MGSAASIIGNEENFTPEEKAMIIEELRKVYEAQIVSTSATSEGTFTSGDSASLNNISAKLSTALVEYDISVKHLSVALKNNCFTGHFARQLKI